MDKVKICRVCGKLNLIINIFSSAPDIIFPWMQIKEIEFEICGFKMNEEKKIIFNLKEKIGCRYTFFFVELIISFFMLRAIFLRLPGTFALFTNLCFAFAKRKIKI